MPQRNYAGKAETGHEISSAYSESSQVGHYIPASRRVSSTEEILQQDPVIPQSYEQLSSTSDVATEKPSGASSDFGTYTCTYHGCTLRFDAPAKLKGINAKTTKMRQRWVTGMKAGKAEKLKRALTKYVLLYLSDAQEYGLTSISISANVCFDWNVLQYRVLLALRSHATRGHHLSFVCGGKDIQQE